MPDCSSVQKSLAWCQGKPELPGVKRRIYYISKYDVLQWPVLKHDANGRLTSASYVGDFVLRADATWKFIDIISDKSQLTSEAQGEYPSQTQLNKLVAVHPGVDEDASAAAAYLNNNDNVFLVEDMRGAVRVVGSDKWPTKTTVAQDLGQGAAGTTSTTINVEATDECPAPFYAGKILTDDGTINPNGNPNQATGGGSSSGDDNLPSGNQGGSTITPATYNNTVTINGTSKNVSGGSVVITGPLTSMRFTGSNMNAIFVRKGNDESEANIASNKTSASWSGNISSGTVKVYRWNGDSENPEEIYWFTITVNAASSSGNTGESAGGNSGSSDSGNSNTGGSTGGNDDSKIIKCSDDAEFNNMITVKGKEYDVSGGHIKVPTSEVGMVYMYGNKLGDLTGINKRTGDAFTITNSWDSKSANFSLNKSDVQVGDLYEVTRKKHDYTSNTCVWFTLEIVSGGNGDEPIGDME